MSSAKIISTRIDERGHRIDTVHMPTANLTLEGDTVLGPTLIQEISYRPLGDDWRWYSTVNLGEI